MPVNMAAGLSVNISIEQLLESEVEEISRDGQEKYVPQLSMSEQLTKLAHKIDFLTEDKNQKTTEDNDVEDDEEEKALVTFQPSLWPWDSVRSKLRNSLTEVCVLSDILNVVQDKKYMVLDPVSQNPAPPKPVVQHLAKRKNLSSAADIVLKGAKRMETAVQERVNQQLRQGKQQEDFHSELIGLRQRWRLKKTGTSIMGDLTYRSAGSQFWNPGLFEVTKATSTEDEESQKSVSHDSSSLEVKVGSDLEGRASVTVAICESGAKQDTVKGRKRVLAKVHDIGSAPLWQQKLQSAQEIIYCKELFNQLCQEAYNSRGPNVNLVMGQEIKTEVFPGVDLCITYTHEKDTDQQQKPKGAMAKDAHDQPVATTLNPLEYALHALLRRRHKHNQSVVLPHPVTARQIPGTNKRLRIAGTAALRANEVTSSLESETILETVIKVSKHNILRKRVMEMIDNLTAEITDPCILCHWSSVSSETCTSAVVHIYSPEIQDIGKVSFRLQIGIKDINVISSSGTSITFTSHLQDLKDFFLTQVAQHRILIAYSIALSLGWQVLHINRHLPTGITENQGHVAGMVVTSSEADRTIAIRTGPSTGVTVSIKRPHKHTNTLPEFLTDKKWSLVGGNFKEVNWNEMPGRTFVQKVSLLLGIETKKP